MNGKPSFAMGSRLFIRELSKTNVLLNRLTGVPSLESASTGLVIFRLRTDHIVFILNCQWFENGFGLMSGGLR